MWPIGAGNSIRRPWVPACDGTTVSTQNAQHASLQRRLEPSRRASAGNMQRVAQRPDRAVAGFGSLPTPLPRSPSHRSPAHNHRQADDLSRRGRCRCRRWRPRRGRRAAGRRRGGGGRVRPAVDVDRAARDANPDGPVCQFVLVARRPVAIHGCHAELVDRVDGAAQEVDIHGCVGHGVAAGPDHRPRAGRRGR